MESNILEALPSLHGILIGIGTAFFSGFAIFAYQKLQESKDQLDKKLEEVASFSTPSTYFGTGYPHLINESGELNWDEEATKILLESKSIFLYQGGEQKYDIQKNKILFNHSEDYVLDTTRKICSMFQCLFVSYPFNGKSIATLEGVSENNDNRKEMPFSHETLREIERRIVFISWCWDISNGSFITLGQKATEIEMAKAKADAVKSFNDSIKKYVEISEEEKENIWNTFYQPRLDNRLDYAKIIQEYFDKVFIYRHRVLPQLSETLKTYDLFNNRFKIKILTTSALKILAIIFVFGVLIPIILPALAQDISLRWHKSLPYFLLFMTVCPYLYLWKKVYSMVKQWEFS